MKKVLYIFVLFGFHTEAQIIAGDSTSTHVLYTRVDTTLSFPFGSTPTAIYDVNSDGINDIEFSGYNSGGLGNSDIYTDVYTLNSSVQIAVIPSHLTWADTVQTGSVINNSLIWRNSNASAYFLLNENGYYHTSSPPYTIYYSYGVFGGHNKYFGFRINNSSDTLYGWFLLSGELTITSYAIQKYAAGISQLKMQNDELRIYPNPAANRVQVTYIDNITNIIAYDVLGKEVLSTKEKDIDVSGLTEGVYFVQVKTSEGTLTKKIIVQR